MDELEIKNRLEEFKNYRALIIVIKPHDVLIPDTKNIINIPEKNCICINPDVYKLIPYNKIVAIKPLENY